MLDRVQRLVGRRIGESTAAARELEALEGKRFAIEISGLGTRVVLRALGGGLAIDTDDSLPADATLSGPPLALLRLLEAQTVTGLHTTAVELRGSVHVAEGFSRALKLAKPELEAELAPWIGDIAAHGVGTALRRVQAWAGRAIHALEADVAEYLQEEARRLPAALEAEAFYGDVEKLRDDVDRTAQRIERLAGKIAPRA